MDKLNFEVPSLEKVAFMASDIITESLCPIDITIDADGGDSGIDYDVPEY